MNMSKTKVMTNSTEGRVEINGERMVYAHEYIYLGQLVSFEARQETDVEKGTENGDRLAINSNVS